MNPVPIAAPPAAASQCRHQRIHAGLDHAYCPDCQISFSSRSQEYKRALAPPRAARDSSGVRAPEPTPERKTGAPAHWIESYPTKKGAHRYYRYRWLDDPDDIRTGGHRHICGGNIYSALALIRKAEIESAIASGSSPNAILRLIKSWASAGNGE